jgi:hypothetical protein
MLGRISSRIGLGAVLLAALAAGCAPATLPYQPMASVTKLSYGYKDTKHDAQHYFVVYSDNREASAQNFLEVRAAEIAKGAGFAYFAFDDRDTNVVAVSETDINQDEPRHIGLRSSHTPNTVNDLIPTQHPMGATRYYFASGHVSLLTDAQAKTNAKAMRVADVLARPGLTLAP